ncbi:MAG TPA: hypothetical protein VL749_04290 [Patescibacteria group bacterium]|nr:hypothetical protein [Patescibacteria group bacterium]
MRRSAAFLSRLAAGAVLVLALAPGVQAAGPPVRGLVPASANVHGHSLGEIATAWTLWSNESADNNPILEERCDPSPLDPRIWFTPEVTSVGGVPDVECNVPAGAFIVIVPAFWECSSVEGDPFHAENEAELIACVEAGFEFIDTVEITIDGRSSGDLDDFALRTQMIELPENNLLSPDAGISMTKGYFTVLHPLTPGTHHARIDATYPAFDFEGITDYTFVVG